MEILKVGILCVFEAHVYRHLFDSGDDG